MLPEKQHILGQNLGGKLGKDMGTVVNERPLSSCGGSFPLLISDAGMGRASSGQRW